MPIRMAKLTRSKNGDFVSRKGIPADVRDVYSGLYRASSKAPMRITKVGGHLTVPKVWEGVVQTPSIDLTGSGKGCLGRMVCRG